MNGDPGEYRLFISWPAHREWRNWTFARIAHEPGGLEMLIEVETWLKRKGLHPEIIEALAAYFAGENLRPGVARARQQMKARRREHFRHVARDRSDALMWEREMAARNADHGFVF